MKKEKNKDRGVTQDTDNKINSENKEGTDAGDKNVNQEIIDQRIYELEQELNDYKDRLLRRAAEFENYKRRTENDQQILFKFASEPFIKKLLPVIDDFDRSLQHIDNSKEIDAVKEGIHLVYDKFKKLLEEQGVVKIEAVGKPFDVHYHEAIMQRKDENAEPNTVLDEIESGYIYKDRVIRHSKVIVSDDSSGIKNKTEE
jgi:molecular chaperone GrpE